MCFGKKEQLIPKAPNARPVQPRPQRKPALNPVTDELDASSPYDFRFVLLPPFLLPLSPHFSLHLFLFMPHLVVQSEEEEYKGANEGRTQKQNQTSTTGTDAGYVAVAPVFVDGGNSVGGEAAHHGYVHHGTDGGNHDGGWSGGDGGGWSGGDG